MKHKDPYSSFLRDIRNNTKKESQWREKGDEALKEFKKYLQKKIFRSVKDEKLKNFLKIESHDGFSSLRPINIVEDLVGDIKFNVQKTSFFFQETKVFIELTDVKKVMKVKFTRNGFEKVLKNIAISTRNMLDLTFIETDQWNIGKMLVLRAKVNLP